MDENNYLEDHRFLYQTLADEIKQIPPGKILDIGAGTGLLYQFIQNREKYDLHAVEIVDEYVEVMNQRGINAVKCNIERDVLPYKNETFDIVIFTCLLEHTLNPKFIINEIYRVLKKGGTLILTTPNALSATRRWNYLRGRNQFWPLIDNLTGDAGYLRRCSIFYSISEIRHVLKRHFTIEKSFFVDEDFYRNRNKSAAITFLQAIAKFFPSFRENIFIKAKKI